jgi:malonate transporter
VAGIALAYACPTGPGWASAWTRRDHAASAQVAFRFNSFIGLALAERLAGAQGLLMIAVLIGVCVPLFNVAAVWPMARHGQPGLCARTAAQPAHHRHCLGAGGQPAGLSHSRLDGAHGEPHQRGLAGLGLMAAGAGMQFGLLTRSKTAQRCRCWPFATWLQPLIAWGMAHCLQLDAVQTTVLLAFSALPTASTCYVLAARMGYNGPYVAGLVTLSTCWAWPACHLRWGFCDETHHPTDAPCWVHALAGCWRPAW